MLVGLEREGNGGRKGGVARDEWGDDFAEERAESRQFQKGGGCGAVERGRLKRHYKGTEMG